MNENRIKQILGTKYPIVQAPMTWITSAELVAAVGNAGGLGTLGSNAGQKTITNDVKETSERMRNEIRKTRQLTDAPFAVNYIVPVKGMPAQYFTYSNAILDVMIEEGVKFAVAVAMDTPDFDEPFKKMKDAGIKIIYRDNTPSIEKARAAEAAGADIIVATGYDEGGAIPSNPIGTFSIVPMIADSVKIPVMAAGGIADNRGVRAALALGAEGVYVGTRFIASVESPASDICKRDIILTESTDLIQFSITPFNFRTIPHKLAFELKELDDHGASSEELNNKLSGTGGGYKRAMLDGVLDEGISGVSYAVSLIKEVKSCKDIIEEMMLGVNY